ncbi:MAG: class I SAM-dependent methyltransferase, partial [Methylobacterium sp.]|nr:class I SAM-dependent methyltransferase [Methylobacterium sp.]
MSPDHAGERAAKDALTTDFGVSRETLERLEAYVALLTQWQETTNLVAPSTIGQIWSRHILDSAQLFALAPNARTWIDLGSGGGLPGLVLAC